MKSPQTPVESLPSPTASWLSTHGRWFLTPLLLALPSLYWVVDGFERIVLLTLGRDQGIFQYVAWAVAHGDRDYGEIRDVNGPLIHLVHLVFMALGGADESRFRFLDAAVNSLVFFAVGWSLPSLFGDRPRPNTDSGNADAGNTGAANTGARTPPWRPWAVRAAWGWAMWTALGIQYLLYLYWDMAQRESFCDWFALLATACLAVALAPEDDGDGSSTSRNAVSKTWKMALLHLAGALSLIPWFGKPTYAVFTVAHLATLVLADEASVSRKIRVRAFCLGGLGGVATQVAYLAAFADVRAFLKAYLSDVPAMYRFIWPKGPQEIFAQNNNSTVAITGLALAGFALALIAEGLWPKRALAWALFPVCGLVNVLAQKKGFPYHFHPVTAGIVLVAVATVAWVSFRRNAKEDASGTERLAPLVLALVGGLVAAREIQQSPHIQNVWILAQGETAELRESRDYLIRFRDKDFFPIELREAAQYLQARTRGTDTVQLYGMDPYLLFLARRKSATPYIYAYDLNVDAALNGGFSLVPTFPQAERIRAMRNAHEADLLARLRKAPPAAFVFIDKSPLMSSEDAQEDFAAHCPETSEWVGKNYRNGATFGEVHVLLRSDLLEGVAEPSQ